MKQHMLAAALLFTVAACSTKSCQPVELDMLDEALWFVSRLAPHKGEVRADVCAEAIRDSKRAAQAVLDARVKDAPTSDLELAARTARQGMKTACGWLGRPAPVIVDLAPGAVLDMGMNADLAPVILPDLAPMAPAVPPTPSAPSPAPPAAPPAPAVPALPVAPMRRSPPPERVEVYVAHAGRSSVPRLVTHRSSRTLGMVS